MKKTTQTLHGSHAMCVCMIFKIIVSRPSIRFQGKKRRKANQRRTEKGEHCKSWAVWRMRDHSENIVWRGKEFFRGLRWNSLKWKWAKKHLIANWVNVTAWIPYLQRVILCGGARCLTTLGSIVQIYEYDVECLWSLCSGGQTIETKQNVISLSCLSCRIVYALSVHFGNPFDCH